MISRIKQRVQNAGGLTAWCFDGINDYFRMSWSTKFFVNKVQAPLEKIKKSGEWFLKQATAENHDVEQPTLRSARKYIKDLYVNVVNKLAEVKYFPSLSTKKQFNESVRLLEQSYESNQVKYRYAKLLLSIKNEETQKNRPKTVIQVAQKNPQRVTLTHMAVQLGVKLVAALLFSDKKKNPPISLATQTANLKKNFIDLFNQFDTHLKEVSLSYDNIKTAILKTEDFYKKIKNIAQELKEEERKSLKAQIGQADILYSKWCKTVVNFKYHNKTPKPNNNATSSYDEKKEKIEPRQEQTLQAISLISKENKKLMNFFLKDMLQDNNALLHVIFHQIAHYFGQSNRLIEEDFINHIRDFFKEENPETEYFSIQNTEYKDLLLVVQEYIEEQLKTKVSFDLHVLQLINDDTKEVEELDTSEIQKEIPPEKEVIPLHILCLDDKKSQYLSLIPSLNDKNNNDGNIKLSQYIRNHPIFSSPEEKRKTPDKSNNNTVSINNENDKIILSL